MYHHGDGVRQDHAEAARLYRLAAAQGNANAQFNLGNMYYNGWGVRQDHAEAVRLYRLAAAQGNAHAQHTLDSLISPAVDLSGNWSLVDQCLFLNINGWVHLKRTGEEEYYFDYKNTIGETAVGHARKNQE
jgi:TPR repeat protein